MTPNLRWPLATLLMLAAVTGLAAGCGGTGTSTDGTAPQITKAGARAYAQAVNLRAADVPGMSATAPEEERVAPQPLDNHFARCVGRVVPDQLLVSIRSAAFRGHVPDKFEQVNSQVEVMPTTRLAAQHNAAYRTSRGLACISRVLAPALAGAGAAEAGYPNVSRLSTPLPGIRGSFGIRIATHISATAGQVPVYIDVFAFLSGPAEVSLLASGAPRPVPAAVEHRLLSLLHRRALARGL